MAQKRTQPLADPPGSCEFGDCERSVEWEVRFGEPLDVVYYCRDHATTSVDLSGFETMTEV